jgi:DNA-binding response OmpR family regulator
MDARILLVEDEYDLRTVLAQALTADGHEVAEAADAAAALDALAERPFDLVMLDIALGDGPDGVEICRRLRRADSDLYVMMLTARDGEGDIVMALEAGADDYVTKPVGIAELRSRVRAVLRRLALNGSLSDPQLLRHGQITLDLGGHRVLAGGSEVSLTQSEFAVLAALLQAKGGVRSRTQLLEAIFGDDAYRDPRAIDFHIHHVRDKLSRVGLDSAIVTVRGAGYRIDS